MKESYGEGVASHTGPESCTAARKGVGEALTGVLAGQVLSRESLRTRSGCRRRAFDRKAIWTGSLRREAAQPRAVGDLEHVRKLLDRELGGPAIGNRLDGAVACMANPTGARPC